MRRASTHELAAERDVVGRAERLLAQLLEREARDTSRGPRHLHLASVHAQHLLLALGVTEHPPLRLSPRCVVLALDEPAARARPPALPGLGRAEVAW